jgi:hypothetical protein
MPKGPRKLGVAFGTATLTHYGGVYLLHRFLTRIGFKHAIAQDLRLVERNNRYSIGEMVLALLYTPSGRVCAWRSNSSTVDAVTEELTIGRPAADLAPSGHGVGGPAQRREEPALAACVAPWRRGWRRLAVEPRG